MTSFDLDRKSRQLLIRIAQSDEPTKRDDIYEWFSRLIRSTEEMEKWGEKRGLEELVEEVEDFECDLRIEKEMECERRLFELEELGLIRRSGGLIEATDKAKELRIRLLEIDYKFMWRQYLKLESRLQDFLSLVPPRPPNFQMWSPELGHLLVGACNILNSLFKATTRHEEFIKCDNLRKYWDKVEPKYPDFQQLYESVYKLSEKVV